jgi:hypothetical protein
LSLLGYDTTPVYGEFLPFFSATPLKLCQVGWGTSLHSYFQVSPDMFDQVQVGALVGPLKDIQRLVPKPLLNKALLPRLLSLAERPALGRVMVVPNFFHLRMMEATVFLGTFNAAEYTCGFVVFLTDVS